MNRMYHILTVVVLFTVLDVEVVNSASVININPNPLETSTAELHAIIDADPTSSSFNEHLASIVKLDSPLELPPEVVKLDAALKPEVSDLSHPPPNVTEPKEPQDDSDLKTDASAWYRYNGYRSPYYSYYRPPYYPIHSYENRYSQPLGQPNFQYYPPYGYYGYRPSSYYSGNYIYSPYRRAYPSYYY